MGANDTLPPPPTHTHTFESGGGMGPTTPFPTPLLLYVCSYRYNQVNECSQVKNSKVGIKIDNGTKCMSGERCVLIAIRPLSL